eukprot:Gregarina_sp_Poly_1__4892@NODE_259_length_10475_cov_62_198501_g226_i0_p11_GENE_NODE_259_length_10475_cov_62_198501_g226_i0NODE_259_length_10475_cov_62_198501_g226_i0_p11_ORF_typecomplete_len126_score22_31_NODE_259_length_10475_cov_62_198501_g226_i087449121
MICIPMKLQTIKPPDIDNSAAELDYILDTAQNATSNQTTSRCAEPSVMSTNLDAACHIANEWDNSLSPDQEEGTPIANMQETPSGEGNDDCLDAFLGSTQNSAKSSPSFISVFSRLWSQKNRTDG